MGSIGDGYGSECHLLRWMGRHRRAFDRTVLAAVRSTAATVEWLDFGFDPATPWADRELKGLEFVARDEPLQAAWREFWPQRGESMNWDAVGWIAEDTGPRLLLVEAKAHTGELTSHCGAKDTRSISTIGKAFVRTKEALGVPMERDWMAGYYQFGNRLATLLFLRDQGLDAHLLNIYFVGDRPPNGGEYPATSGQWQVALSRRDEQLGLPEQHALSDRVHKLFLHVSQCSA